MTDDQKALLEIQRLRIRLERLEESIRKDRTSVAPSLATDIMEVRAALQSIAVR